MEIVDELYRYQHKRVSLAFAYATVGGIFGAHRFYLGRTLTGLVMLLTFGGGLFWWFWDLFHIRSRVQALNLEEDARAKEQLPPQRLGFLPRKQDLKLSGPPPWTDKSRSRIRVFGSAIVLGLIGLSIGAISGATGVFEPVLIIVVFITVTLTSPRCEALSEIFLNPGVYLRVCRAHWRTFNHPASTVSTRPRGVGIKWHNKPIHVSGFADSWCGLEHRIVPDLLQQQA